MSSAAASSLVSAEEFVGAAARTDPLLSIVLTIHKLPKMTRRWLAYADAQHLPFRIIIADGSEDHAILEHLRSVSYPNLSVEYLRFQPDRAYKDYYAKLAASARRVSTEYCLLADNDDFFSVAGVEKCLAFLEANSDFAACQGEWVGFRLSGDGGDVFATSVLFSNAYRPFYDFDSIDACDRFDALSRANVQTWYAVTRTRVLREDFEFVEKLSPSDLFLVEVAREFGLLAAGKVKCLSVPYYFRQVATEQSSNEELAAREGMLDERILFTSFSADLQAIKSWLVGLTKGEDRAEVERKVQSALSRFMISVISGYFSQPPPSARRFRRFKERVRDTIAEQPLMSGLLNGLRDRNRGDARIRMLYQGELSRIRAFLRAWAVTGNDDSRR